MDRFDVEGMAENEGDVLIDIEISAPLPDKHALQSDHAPSIQDTDEHVFGMQVDSTIKFLWLGIKSHIGFLLLMGYSIVVNLLYHL